MTDPDLVEALVPVRKYFRGSSINRNTVLAAWIRRYGVQPHGLAWDHAKAALDEGLSFAEAAAAAAGSRPETRESARVAESDAESGQDVENLGSLPSTEREHEAPRMPTPVPIERGHDRPVRRLDWYPKVFGPGDIVGEGAIRLLGTPNIPLVSVLVRETAQNSWDARTARSPVRFTLNLRLLNATEHSALREIVFTGSAPKLGLHEALSKGELWVLEISDRGTKGLGGPVRNDRAVPTDQTTDFIDLIFNIGAPRDVQLGAGTYGFGKSITYKASSCGTVIFWSRSNEPSGIQDRVIASAFGGTFEMEGLNHTGRHWWGRVDPLDGRIEPVLDRDAAEVASAIFQDSFGVSETGTSMMILDPQLGYASREEDAAALAEAVAWNLWPKLLDAGPGRTQMHVEVRLNGAPVPLPDPRTDAMLSGYADCLEQVRAVQSGQTYTPDFFTEVQPIFHGQTGKLLGHLALSRYPYRGEERGSEVAPFAGPSSHVALMRHDAELVVKYWPRQRLESEGFQWAGVFKPVAGTDNSFADAEPPAHDDWVPKFIQDRRKRSEVNVALNKTKECVTEFLTPSKSVGETSRSLRSVAALADRLSGLVGPVPGSAPTLRTSRRSHPRSSSYKPQLSVVQRWQGDTNDGRHLVGLLVTVAGRSSRPVLARAAVAVGVEGSQDRDADLVSIVGWVPDRLGGGAPDLSKAPRKGLESIKPGQETWLLVEATDGLAIDVTLTVEDPTS